MIKHTFKQIAALFFAAFLCIGMASCEGGTEGGGTPDGDDNNDDPIETPTQPEEPSEEEAMSPLEQKQYLESVAIEFLNAIPAAEQMEELAGQLEELGRLGLDDYNNEPLQKWWEDAYKACLKAAGAPTTVPEEEWYGPYHYIYNYIYTPYNGLFMASNFTGHFIGTQAPEDSAFSGSWKIEKANDLQFILNRLDGTTWVLKLTTSGAVKKVHVANFDAWSYGEDYDAGVWDPDQTEFERNYYYDRINATIGVPENIEVSLARNGEVLAKTTLNIDLNSLNGEEFDLNKSNFSVKVSSELGSRIKVEVNKVAYNGNNNASASAIVLVDNKPVLTLAASTAISGLPSANASAFGSMEPEDYDDANAKNTYVKLDIMSKVQFQGTLSDARKFYDYMESAYDNDQNEKNFKSYINQANALFDINIFYNETAVKQAAVKLEPFEDTDWWDERYWDVEPVIHFFDGTSYSTFEAFFNDKDFKETIKTFERLLEEYKELLGIEDEDMIGGDNWAYPDYD